MRSKTIGRVHGQFRPCCNCGVTVYVKSRVPICGRCRKISAKATAVSNRVAGQREAQRLDEVALVAEARKRI